MKQYTQHHLFRIAKIQAAAAQVKFTDSECRTWTSVDNIQFALDRLTNDKLMMIPRSGMTLKERQESCALGLSIDLSHCLAEFVKNPTPPGNEISLNSEVLKSKLIALSDLIF